MVTGLQRLNLDLIYIKMRIPFEIKLLEGTREDVNPSLGEYAIYLSNLDGYNYAIFDTPIFMNKSKMDYIIYKAVSKNKEDTSHNHRKYTSYFFVGVFNVKEWVPKIKKGLLLV